MKWRFLGAALFLPVLTAAQTLPSEVSVCWEEGLKPPYLSLDSQGQVAGIAVDMVNEIFKRRQLSPKHLIRPWKRCLAEVETGEVDVVPNSSYRDERAQYALYTEPLYTTHLVLFYHTKRFAQAPVIRQLDEMKPYSFGGILGFNYDQYAGQLKLDTTAKNREVLFRMLIAGRYDFAIEQLEVIQMMKARKELSLEQMAYIAEPVQPVKNFHILVTKKHPQAEELRRLINDGIAAIKRDGTAKKIQIKHLGD
ncbi:transporter substrate-binding domain-containing protein [Chitinibacter sp. SCUT-21]|uniref:substrate-binding periplasmic protein n=1 Tax=Chitinibacter sp. SCUT-21 TaxID=2970891 RepID=UPI0035A5DA55